MLALMSQRSLKRGSTTSTYSPDVNLMDRFVFRNFEVFRAKVLDSANVFRETISEFLSSLKPNDFHSQFDHLKQDLLNIISNDGNYI